MFWLPTAVDSNKKKQVIFTSESYNQHQAADMLEGKLFCNQCKVALVPQKDARQGIWEMSYLIQIDKNVNETLPLCLFSKGRHSSLLTLT